MKCIPLLYLNLYINKKVGVYLVWLKLLLCFLWIVFSCWVAMPRLHFTAHPLSMWQIQFLNIWSQDSIKGIYIKNWRYNFLFLLAGLQKSLTCIGPTSVNPAKLEITGWNLLKESPVINSIKTKFFVLTNLSHHQKKDLQDAGLFWWHY